MTAQSDDSGANETASTETLHAIEDGLDEVHRYLKRQWRDRPATVVASAFGIGLIVGLMLGRR